MNLARAKWLCDTIAFRILALVLWLWASLAGCSAGSEMGGTSGGAGSVGAGIGGGGGGDGMQCASNQDCPATDNECVTRACIDGRCDTTNAPDGTLCAFASSCAAGLCSSNAIEAYIKASNTGEQDLFGSRVALSGDGKMLAVGAYKESSNAMGINGNQADNSAPGAGAVYVY